MVEKKKLSAVRWAIESTRLTFELVDKWMFLIANLNEQCMWRHTLIMDDDDEPNISRIIVEFNSMIQNVDD